MPPNLLFEALEASSSPYINRFLSADTIVPGYANPQNLNRYSYVTNNPLRYTDPTGHMLDPYDGGGGCNSLSCLPQAPNNPPSGKGGKSDDDGNNQDEGSCDTNGNLVADIPCPGLYTRDWNDIFTRANGTDALCPLSASLVECYYAHASLDMGQTPVNIDSQAFLDLMLAIYYEINGRNGVDLSISSITFDTPFYDLGRIGKPGLQGIGCINGLGCYARHELNYIAQGEISAAAGQSRQAGLLKVYAWKATFGGGRRPSAGTIEMYNIGYDFYHEQNGSTPPSFYEFTWLPPLFSIP